MIYYSARFFVFFYTVTYLISSNEAEYAESENINILVTEEGETIWEGDMILSEEQIDSINGVSRKARDDPKYRWSGGKVPFAISQSSEEDRDVLLEAIDHWRQSSCLTFEEVPEDSEFPHLIFVKKIGCHTKVGMQSDGPPFGQEVSIGHGCERMGKIAHEIGHGIGFYHEQSRPDRNDYVIIKENNIEETHLKNFQIHHNINTYDVPYDLTSIMHYNSKEFSMNGKTTVVTMDIMKQFAIGQRNALSFYDRQLASIMYNCSDLCSSKPKCKNGGFVDHNCGCQCPPDFRGKLCENIILPPEPECGGIIESPGQITTPDFPQYFPAETNCVWWIKAPGDKTVSVHFDTFQVGHRKKSSGCREASVEIRTDDIYEGEVYCGTELNEQMIKSDSNEMVILLWTKNEYQDRGLSAQIKFL